jgi:PAS domain-containing protein
LPGGNSEREPPDPIPNSEVKTLCADGSLAASHARVGHCQALETESPAGKPAGLFCFCVNAMTEVPSRSIHPERTARGCDMFGSNRFASNLHEQLSVAFSAVHRAAFEDADRTDAHSDPMLAVPVRLIPLVQAARALRGMLERESAARTALQGLLDLSRDALMAIDGERNILFANAAARKMLGSGVPYRCDAERLYLADAEEDRCLEHALRGDAAPEAIPGIARATRLGRISGRPWLLFSLPSAE